jgi:hypothetical protein
MEHEKPIRNWPNMTVIANPVCKMLTAVVPESTIGECRRFLLGSSPLSATRHVVLVDVFC